MTDQLGFFFLLLIIFKYCVAFPFLQEAPVQRLVIMACNVEAVLVEHVEQITSAYASLGTLEVHVIREVTRNPSFLVHN